MLKSEATDIQLPEARLDEVSTYYHCCLSSSNRCGYVCVSVEMFQIVAVTMPSVRHFDCLRCDAKSWLVLCYG